MELRAFMRRQSVAALVLVPLVVGSIVAALFASTQDRPYDASTTVNVADGLDADPESFGITGRVDDFVFTIESPTVESAVREELGLSPADPGGELAAAPVGNGSLVEVTHRADTAEQAVDGLDVGVATALRALAQQRLDRASSNVGVIDGQIETLNARLAELEAAAGSPDVASQYRDTAARVQQLETTLAERAGDPAFDPEAVNALLVDLTARRDSLGAVVNEWEQVKARLEEASATRETAELERLGAEQIVDRAASGERFFATEVSQASTLEVVALPALAAAIAALGVVLGASLLRQRNQIRARSKPQANGARATRPAVASHDGHGVVTSTTKARAAARR